MKKQGFSSHKPPARLRVLLGLVVIATLLAVIGLSYDFVSHTPFIGMSNQYLRLSHPYQDNSIDSVNPDATINIPFIREGHLYLYQDGEEKLIAQPERDTVDHKQRFDLAFPELSPNQRYVAFLQYDGEVLEYGQTFPSGVVRILDIRTGNIQTTSYKALSFSWNSLGQLEIEDRSVWDKVNQLRYVLYDPETSREVSSLSDEIDNSVSGDHISAFPFYSHDKFIKFRDDKFFLVNGQPEQEKLMATVSELRKFMGWSPDGKYALFRTDKKPPEDSKNEWFQSVWAAVNTQDFSEPWKEFVVRSGGGGGEPSVGSQWYFNHGFVAYCSPFLTFLDGREPLDLRGGGGGGCHNEDGFVATSPNGQYAFIQMADEPQFQLHSKNNGTITQQAVRSPLKELGSSATFRWVSNDSMAIYVGSYTTESSDVYLFDRQKEEIRLLIDNAHLLSF